MGAGVGAVDDRVDDPGGAVDVVAVTSLGEPPVAVVVVEDGPSTARGVLKGVTAASGAAFAKALASARDTLVRGGGEAAAPLSAGVAKVVGALATAVAWMQQKLRPSEDQLPPRTDTALPPRALPAARRARRDERGATSETGARTGPSLRGRVPNTRQPAHPFSRTRHFAASLR